MQLLTEDTVGEGQRLGAESLAAFFTRVPKFAVAFSGGCDSSYLLAAAKEAGCTVKAYMVNTAFQPAFELEDAFQVIRQLDIPFEILEADILQAPNVGANTPNRCYWCKRFLLGLVKEKARADGFEILTDGTNATDKPERRPGFVALRELEVLSPLRRGSLTKDIIRDASRKLNVLTANKANFSCLAAKSPEGTHLTPEVLLQTARSLGLQPGAVLQAAAKQ